MKKFLMGAALVAALVGAAVTPASADPSARPSGPNAYVGAAADVPSPTPTASASALPTPTDTPTPTASSPPAHVGPSKVLLLGDSITAGWLLATQFRMEACLASDLGVSPSMIINHAVGGQALLDGPAGGNLSDIWDAQLDLLSPGDVLYVQIGTNDLFTYAGDQAWTSTYAGMVSRALARGIHVIVGLITPMASAQWSRELLRQHLNQWLKDVFGPAVNDSDAALHNATTGQTWIDPRYGWSVNGAYDGIHLNEGGQEVLAYALAQKIRASSWWLVA